jgi:hypothetical protein
VFTSGFVTNLKVFGTTATMAAVVDALDASEGARHVVVIGCDAGAADQQVEDVVLGVDGDDREDRVAVADDEAPDCHDDVDGTESQRSASFDIHSKSG